MTAVGAVLCGGRSTRMGQDKASLLLDGRPMSDWVAGSMKHAGVESIVALGGKPSVNLPIIHDELKQQGPLHVLIKAIERLGDIVVCPCDVPLVTPKLFREVLDMGAKSNEPVVLVQSDQLQPLIGLYKESAIGLLAAGFARGERGPKFVLQHGDFVVVEASAEETQNINTPEEFSALVSSLSASHNGS